MENTIANICILDVVRLVHGYFIFVFLIINMLSKKIGRWGNWKHKMRAKRPGANGIQGEVTWIPLVHSGQVLMWSPGMGIILSYFLLFAMFMN
jgi:hypothetical protein